MNKVVAEEVGGVGDGAVAGEEAALGVVQVGIVCARAVETVSRMRQGSHVSMYAVPNAGPRWSTSRAWVRIFRTHPCRL